MLQLCPSFIFTHHYRFNYDLSTWLSLVSGETNVSGGSSLRDGQDTSSQQLQQDDTVETFRQKYLNSGKFNSN